MTSRDSASKGEIENPLENRHAAQARALRASGAHLSHQHRDVCNSVRLLLGREHAQHPQAYGVTILRFVRNEGAHSQEKARPTSESPSQSPRKASVADSRVPRLSSSCRHSRTEPIQCTYLLTLTHPSCCCRHRRPARTPSARARKGLPPRQGKKKVTIQKVSHGTQMAPRLHLPWPSSAPSKPATGRPPTEEEKLRSKPRKSRSSPQADSFTSRPGPLPNQCRQPAPEEEQRDCQSSHAAPWDCLLAEDRQTPTRQRAPTDRSRWRRTGRTRSP